MSPVKFSIIIPVKNGIKTLPALLAGIESQTEYNNSEIIIIDSGSQDGSIEFLNRKDVNLIQIKPEAFNHGATRNLGVSHARGEFVFFSVQDAYVEDPELFEKMVAYFEDPQVAGVCGQQIVPHDKDKNPHEWFRPFSSPQPRRIRFNNEDEFWSLAPKVKREICAWDNVISMYRKEILLRLPFEPVVFGEDMLWGKAALLSGYTLIYDYSARVNHYHYHYPEYTYRRTLISNLFIYKNFGWLRSNLFGLRDFLLIIYRNMKWKCHPKWILHNVNILKYKNKATKDLIFAVKTSRIMELEESLSLHIPIGKQKNRKG